MKLVSRASRPGLTVGVLRILCNGLCTAQRFHTEDYEQNVSGWMPERTRLSLITTNALVCTMCLDLFGDRLQYFHEETISYMT